MNKRKINTDSLVVPSIGKTLRYIEWIAIATSAIAILSDTSSQPPRIFSNLVVLTLLFSLVPLSLIFPVDRPIWQKRAYILLESVLILLTAYSKYNLELNLYLTYAKACLLLRRKDVIIIVIAAGIVWLLIPPLMLTIPEIIEYIQSQSTSGINPQSLILKSLIERLSAYLAGSTFVILFSFVMVAERRSREKAIKLAQEIDFLAAALERSRIARNIHDSLGHTLTTLDIQLELAQRLYDRNPDKARSALNNAKNLADRSLSDVRRSVQTMRSETFNLDEAIKSLVAQIEQNLNLAVKLDLNLPNLPPKTSYQLYSIVKEGLTNIQKHAQASFVSIRGQPTPQGIILEIEDNGRGFNPNLVDSGYGILGMKERVDNLEGDFKINSAIAEGVAKPIARGTCIQVTIPL